MVNPIISRARIHSRQPSQLTERVFRFTALKITHQNSPISSGETPTGANLMRFLLLFHHYHASNFCSERLPVGIQLPQEGDDWVIRIRRHRHVTFCQLSDRLNKSGNLTVSITPDERRYTDYHFSNPVLKVFGIYLAMLKQDRVPNVRIGINHAV